MNNVLSSFPISCRGNELTLAVAPKSYDAPADAAQLNYVVAEENPESVARYATIHEGLADGALVISGHCIDQKGSAGVNLAMGTSDSLCLANWKGNRRVNILYNEGLKGDTALHLVEILFGIRSYLQHPVPEGVSRAEFVERTVSFAPPKEIHRNIEAVVLRLSEGAVRVWNERFAPYAGDKYGIRYIVDCLTCIDYMRAEKFLEDERREVSGIVTGPLAVNPDVQRTIGRIEEYVRAIIKTSPTVLATDETRKIAEGYYAAELREGKTDHLEADPWDEKTVSSLIFFIDDLRIMKNKNTQERPRPRSLLSELMKSLRALGMPEYNALSPEFQEDVAQRIINERLDGYLG